MVSIATERSSRVNAVTLPSSIDDRISLCILRRVVSVVSCNLVDRIGTDLIVFVNAVSGSCLYIVKGPLPVPCRSSIVILNAASQALQTS